MNICLGELLHHLSSPTGIYLYRRSSTNDYNDSCVLRNNSAADGDVDLNTTYGIACNRPSLSHTVTWYNPSGIKVGERRDLHFVFFKRENDGDQDIRRSSNFRGQDEGVYTCNVTDQDGNSQYLYVGVYRIRSPTFTMVNLKINSCFEDSIGAILVLNCSSSALPATNVRWYFNDQLTSVGEQVQHIPNGRTTTYNSLLRIRGHELTGDMLEVGQYRCLLESGNTSVNVTQMLRISKPKHRSYSYVCFRVLVN